MDFELAEHLLRWGTLDELVAAISESGPLIDRSIYKEENRRLSINEAIEVVEESVGGGDVWGNLLPIRLCPRDV